MKKDHFTWIKELTWAIGYRYGAMMWSLGKVVQTPEVMRVYLGSFWVEKPPNCFEDCRELIEAESKDLLRDLKELRRNAAIRKINEIVKRARLARVCILVSKISLGMVLTHGYL